MNTQNMGPIRPTLAAGYEPPVPRSPLCRRCGKVIEDMAALAHPDDAYHDPCHPSRIQFAQGSRIVGVGDPRRQMLVDIVRRRLASSERSQQVAIGPSQVGERCVRKLAMMMAGVPETNVVADLWPTGVGTAIHDVLAAALLDENHRLGRERWLVERKVEPDPIIRGTSDAFDQDEGEVLDWKSIGKATSEVARKMERGDLDTYYTQIQIYGLGWAKLGFRVRTVALAFVPKSGMIRDMAYIRWPFDPNHAESAIKRVYSIAEATRDLLQTSGGSDPWSQVPCDTTGYCGWCPYYNKNVESASSNGCPGK